MVRLLLPSCQPPSSLVELLNDVVGFELGTFLASSFSKRKLVFISFADLVEDRFQHLSILFEVLKPNVDSRVQRFKKLVDALDRQVCILTKDVRAPKEPLPFVLTSYDLEANSDLRAAVRRTVFIFIFTKF